jgi:PAS domain S-box-containing protein
MVTKALPISEKEAAAYFFDLFNANIMPMTTWKYDGTFTSVNDAFLKLIGYTRKDFEEGKVNWRNITPPEYEQVDENCVQELKLKGSSKPFIKEFNKKDGSRVRVQINNCLLNKNDDHGLGIIFEAYTDRD